MPVVSSQNRRVLGLPTFLIASTLGLNMSNFIQLTPGGNHSRVLVNHADPEAIPIFGIHSAGLAAVFMSLASNLCATVVVGLKAS